MSQKTYLNILKFGIYLSLITVFFVFKNLLFPFITSKQISFNILIEVLFVFWLAFIVKYPEYKPKKSLISFGLIGFFIALILSCFISVDLNLSFWGDIERMLGVFHLLHFLALYFIIITVFRGKKDWKILFTISVIFAVFVSFKSISGKAYSTIGNTAYVSGYLIFNIYFCLLLFFLERNKGLRWLYIIPVPIILIAFRGVHTVGAHVGLGFSIIVLVFLYGILNKSKKVRTYIMVAWLLLVLLVGLAFVNKESDWVTKNPVLKMVGEVNVQKNTFQTRLISWRAAAKDFKEHPILGTGHGNYAIIFDKYFEPTFYDHTRSETYFDRAHNNLIDIVSTTGLVGLLTYLFIFIAAAYYLIKGYREDKLSVHEFILISCLIIAYFVQNLAVFDSLVTYVGLMIVLAYIYWRYNKTNEEEVIDSEFTFGDYGLIIGFLLFAFIVLKADKISYFAENNMRILWFYIITFLIYTVWVIVIESKREKSQLENKEIYTLVGAGIILFTIMYQYNIKPLKMLVGTIDGQRALSQGNIEETIKIYKKALSYNTVLDRDSRTSLNRVFASGTDRIKGFDKNKAQEILDYNIELAEVNVKYNPGDSLNQMMLAQILNTTARFNSGNPEKFSYYSNRALEAIDKSIAASPGRIPIYFQKAQIFITRSERDKAIEALKYAVSLNEKYYDSSCYLSKTLFIFEQPEEAYRYMDKCIEYGGVNLLSPVGFVRSLKDYYIQKEDFAKAIKLYERLTRLESDNVKNWIELAKFYIEYGERYEIADYKEKAREAAFKAAEIDPSIQQYVDGFIKGMEK